jgi:hypothetical protein
MRGVITSGGDLAGFLAAAGVKGVGGRDYAEAYAMTPETATPRYRTAMLGTIRGLGDEQVDYANGGSYWVGARTIVSGAKGFRPTSWYLQRGVYVPDQTPDWDAYCAPDDPRACAAIDGRSLRNDDNYRTYDGELGFVGVAMHGMTMFLCPTNDAHECEAFR